VEYLCEEVEESARACAGKEKDEATVELYHVWTQSEVANVGRADSHAKTVGLLYCLIALLPHRLTALPQSPAGTSIHTSVHETISLSRSSSSRHARPTKTTYVHLQ
jgi:hypothetical protein